MDGTKFDEITQRLSAAASRRRLVSGLLAGAAMLTGAAVAQLDDVAAKKGGNGKGKKKGHGKNNGKGKGKGRTKVFICHKGQVLHVAAPSLKGHLKHGDTECGEAPVCHTGNPTGCADDGTCTFAQLPEGTECTTEDGDAGTCNAEGVCVVSCAGEGESCASVACCEGLTCSAESVCELV